LGEHHEFPRSTSAVGALFDLSTEGLIPVTVTAGDDAQEVLNGFQATHLNENSYEIAVPHPHTLKRVIANNAGAVVVQHPSPMRKGIQPWAESALAQYDEKIFGQP